MNTIIESAEPDTTTVVRVNFTTTEVIPAAYVKHEILPFHAELRYRYETSVTEDGWTEHAWRCDDAKVIGWRVLKPGPNGKQRVSDKASHDVQYWAFGKKDVSTLSGCPDFLRELVDACRPSGEVRNLTV